MNNFDEIQQLWQISSPKYAVPPKEIARQIKKKQRRERLTMVSSTVALALTFFFILFISFHYRFAFLSTHIGIALILLSIVAAVFLNSRMTTLLYRNDINTCTNNKTMLVMMEQYQQRQQFFQTTFMSVYYLLLTLGLVLYLYELTRSSYLFMLAAYSITLGWIAFAWWYIRPRAICKQKERMNVIINHIKSLQDELSEAASVQAE